MKNAILGVNHQFLYPEAIVDAVAHTESLKRAAMLESVDALDCWVWRGQRSREEIAILHESYFALRGRTGTVSGILGMDHEPNSVDSIYQLTREED